MSRPSPLPAPVITAERFFCSSLIISTSSMRTVAVSDPGPLRSVSERRLEIHEDSQLLQKNRDSDVTVKREDFAILEVEYVAARSVYLLSGGGNRTRGDHHVALVCHVKR